MEIRKRKAQRGSSRNIGDGLKDNEEVNNWMERYMDRSKDKE
jgi:hypothetical protein